ncbi:MAG: HAD family hydrolase [Alphaproteobacteria bacterium]|nr:HAD family hydrolase [Alphaproteobacteria bacterium]
MPFPRLVAFDLDGTLVDSREAIVGTFNGVLARAGLPRVEPAWIHGQIGQPLRDMLRRAVPPPLRPDDLGPLEAAYHQAFLQHAVARVKPQVHALALLDTLAAADVALALVTTRQRGSTDAILAHVGLAGRFARVVAGDEVASPKPDPEGLLRVLADLGVSAEDAVYVGDTRVDVEAGDAAGVRVVAVAHGAAAAEELAALGAEVAADLREVEACLGTGAPAGVQR